MANTESIQSVAATGVSAFPSVLLNMPELEKVSCSIRGKSRLHPLALMGKRIRNAQLAHACNRDGYPAAPKSSITVSTVLAVHLGSIEHGIETSLLLQDADGSDPYYADIENLTVLEVLQ